MSFFTRQRRDKQLIERLLNREVDRTTAGTIAGPSIGTLPQHTHDSNAQGGHLLKFPAATTLTIAAGAVTLTQRQHAIDTEGAAASDDLDTLNGLVANQLYIIRPANTARTVNVRHIGGGTGNIRTVNGGTLVLDDAEDFCFVFSPDGVTAYAFFDTQGAGGAHTHDHGSELTGLGDPDHDEIADADNDTGWRSEASADEDKLRARTAGTERMVIQAQSTSEGALLFKFIQHLRLNAPGILVENTGDGGDPAGIFLWYVFSDAFQLLRKTTAGNLFNTANYVEAMRVDRATGDMTVGNLNLQDPASTAAKTLRFYDNDLSNYIGVKAPGTAQSEDWVIVLPADDPAANEVLAVSSVSSPTVTTEWRAIGSYYAPTTYVFVADVAIDTNVTTGDNQGGVFHHSYDNAEPVKRIITEFEVAPTGAAATIQLEYGDTDDLDTVATWTEIDLVSHTAAAKTIITTSSFTNASIPANRLIRMNVDAVGSTEPGENLTVHLQVLRPLVAS